MPTPPSYALDCKPINAMAKANYDDLKKLLVDGCICIRALSCCGNDISEEKKGIAPDMADGDEEILRQAASQITFMGVNYYQSCVCEYNPMDGATPYGTMNTTGVKGSAQELGMPGIYKNPANPYLMTTDWD